MKKLFTIFGLTGILYVFVEVLYNAITSFDLSLIGHSSLWMLPVGGFLSTILGEFNEKKSLAKLDYRVRVILGGIAITAIELISGLILNRLCGFGIWDYSHNPLNFLGQIDALHSTYWVLISPFVFWVDDVIRHYMFNEERPTKLFTYYKRIITG